jgi:uncharacterized peroxidase-related enzyme
MAAAGRHQNPHETEEVDAMARVSDVPETALPDDLRPLYRKFAGGDADFTNQLRVVAHSPDAFRHLYGLIDAWREHGSLPRRLVEIAVVTASRVNDCAYCVGHHGTALIRLGLDAETVERILDDVPPGLDERERLVRDYARLVGERAWGIRDKTIADLKKHFSDRQIVELTIRIGLCVLFNKLNQALEIGIEDAVATDAANKNVRLAGKAPAPQRPL